MIGFRGSAWRTCDVSAARSWPHMVNEDFLYVNKKSVWQPRTLSRLSRIDPPGGLNSLFPAISRSVRRHESRSSRNPLSRKEKGELRPESGRFTSCSPHQTGERLAPRLCPRILRVHHRLARSASASPRAPTDSETSPIAGANGRTAGVYARTAGAAQRNRGVVG